jgi:hypothetical protein
MKNTKDIVDTPIYSKTYDQVRNRADLQVYYQIRWQIQNQIWRHIYWQIYDQIEEVEL